MSANKAAKSSVFNGLRIYIADLLFGEAIAKPTILGRRCGMSRAGYARTSAEMGCTLRTARRPARPPEAA